MLKIELVCGHDDAEFPPVDVNKSKITILPHFKWIIKMKMLRITLPHVEWITMYILKIVMEDNELCTPC